MPTILPSNLLTIMLSIFLLMVLTICHHYGAAPAPHATQCFESLRGIARTRQTPAPRPRHSPEPPGLRTIDYTRAYVHHLFKQNEPLAASLASLHNIMVMNHLMSSLRERIIRDEV